MYSIVNVRLLAFTEKKETIPFGESLFFSRECVNSTSGDENCEVGVIVPRNQEMSKDNLELLISIFPVSSHQTALVLFELKAKR